MNINTQYTQTKNCLTFDIDICLVHTLQHVNFNMFNRKYIQIQAHCTIWTCLCTHRIQWRCTIPECTWTWLLGSFELVTLCDCNSVSHCCWTFCVLAFDSLSHNTLSFANYSTSTTVLVCACSWLYTFLFQFNFWDDTVHIVQTSHDVHSFWCWLWVTFSRVLESSK